MVICLSFRAEHSAVEESRGIAGWPFWPPSGKQRRRISPPDKRCKEAPTAFLKALLRRFVWNDRHFSAERFRKTHFLIFLYAHSGHSLQRMFETVFQQESSPFIEEFRALAIAEARTPPPRDALLFYGSSSIRLWATLAQDFADVPVVNHGFGGSTLADCIGEMERLVFPIEPRAIVLYAGDNDLDQGAQPGEVLTRFRTFVENVRERLGRVPILFLSVKPSPIRFWNSAKIRHTNALIADAICKQGVEAHMHFLDVFHPMLNDAREPRRELFDGDGLHMNATGYALWTSLVRGALADLCVLR